MMSPAPAIGVATSQMVLIERAYAWISSARCTGSAMSLSLSTFWLSDAADVSKDKSVMFAIFFRSVCNVDSHLSFTRGEEIVIDLARAENNAAHSGRIEGVGDDRFEFTRGQFAER